MDTSDIGRYGILSLLRRLPVDSVVTSYPIDDEELTIGRDQSCSLRLYYPAVSALHAKITFVERKAFLVVLGTNGLLLDDAPLFPAAASAPGPTTVPLQNNSVIEIHKKRFRFAYPPKHLRPALINTPSRATPMPSRRPLRMSMIASAHVFTPGPSPDPQENLRVLQTPLRTPFAREQEEIVLVHSNTPRVVEEDKDLVILDEVEPEPAPMLPLPLPIAHQPPKTPRVHIQREMEMEEEQEVEEVEETIAAIAEADECDDDVQEVSSPGEQSRLQVTGWRKSIDMVKGSLGWAFRGLSVEPKQEDQEETIEHGDQQEEESDGEYDEEMEENEDHNEEDGFEENYAEQYHEEEPRQHEEEPEPVRPLGRFMSPQLQRTTSAGSRAPRMSLGGGAHAGPQRVRLVAPWKVSEIQVPSSVKEEENGKDAPSANRHSMAPPATPLSAAKRERLTEEEREAIRARRRSALATPDNFFNGQVPGSRRKLFPSFAPLPSPNFTAQPVQSFSASTSTPTSRAEPSSQPLPSSIKEESPPTATASSSTVVKAEADSDDEKEDTAVLLARMRQMVEGVKQRQSLGRQSLNVSPRKRESGFSLLAPGHAATHTPSRILIDEDDERVTAGPSHTARVEDVQQERAREEEVEMQGDDGEDASVRAQLSTPCMSDLRHVFGRAHQAEPRTPALAGVRDMFRANPGVRPAPHTPEMDGVPEMLGTPVAYRRQASPERLWRHVDAHVYVERTANDARQEEEAAEKVQEEEEEPHPVEDQPAKSRRTAKTASSKIARRATVPAPLKSTRGASKPPEESTGNEQETRRTRAHTAEGTVGHQPPRAAARRKAAETKPVTPEPGEDEEKQAAATAPRTTRRAGSRTRGGSVNAATPPAVAVNVEPAIPEDKENTPERDEDEEEGMEEEAETKAKTPAARRGAVGKTRRTTAKAAAEKEEGTPAPTVAKTRRTRAARS
ncbi:hypothetical protein BN946_scf184996.g43 [Trametes cinnabarina]|uniref:FHA domain-containing protein n=1 Tax=Pycnoporus cinnabarinus TaxID=5643 RepID=A0A060S2J7_PYCCI|nr:hypothetical protein BN946_scf184996.g43 [Trametes cinnabarina]